MYSSIHFSLRFSKEVYHILSCIEEGRAHKGNCYFVDFWMPYTVIIGLVDAASKGSWSTTRYAIGIYVQVRKHMLHITSHNIHNAQFSLQMEVGRYTRILLEERICHLCHQGVESEEHYVCHCSVFYEIRGRYHCLFKQGFGPIRKVIEYEDQRC